MDAVEVSPRTRELLREMYDVLDDGDLQENLRATDEEMEELRRVVGHAD